MEATHKHWTRIKVFETLISGMEGHLMAHGAEVPEAYAEDELDDD